MSDAASGGANTLVAADRQAVTILASTALPTTYVAPGISLPFNLNAGEVGWVLQLDVTVGTITSIQFILQGSPDGTTWYSELSEATVAGVATLKKKEYTVAIADLAAVSDTVFLNFKRGAFYRYRYCFKETGNKTDELLVAKIRKVLGDFAG